MKSVPENIYLQTCSSSFPGAQSASFSTLNSPGWGWGVLKIRSCSSTGFNLHRGRWQTNLLLFSHWQMLLSSTNSQLTEVKNPHGNVGDVGWISLRGKPPREENGNTLQHSCLEIQTENSSRLQSMDHKESNMAQQLNNKNALSGRAGLVAQIVKNLPAMQETQFLSVPGLGSSPGEGNGNPFQYPYLENSMDRGYNPWYCRVGHD